MESYGAIKIDEMRQVLKDALRVDDAALFQSTVDASQEVRAITLDLTTARTEQNPFPIGFPFRSFVVISATDTNVSVNLRLATQDSFQDRITLKRGNSLKLPFPIGKAFIDFSAQSGKSITILFFQKGEFATNVLDLVNSGGVTISDGTAITINQKTLTAITPSIICALDTTRKTAQFRNETGSDFWLGGSAVADTGANKGFVLKPNEIFTYRNTAALYGYSVAGGTVTVMEEN